MSVNGKPFVEAITFLFLMKTLIHVKSSDSSIVPYLLQLRDGEIFLCDAILVEAISGKQIALTSGTCVSQEEGILPTDNLTLIGGSGNEDNEQIRNVLKIERHHDWSRGAGLSNDIAVIFLSQEFQLDSFVNPTYLPWEGEDAIASGTLLQLSIWDNTMDLVQTTEIDALNSEDCVNAVNSENSIFCAVTDPEICAITSGSPAVSSTEDGSYLVGILSGADLGCGSQSKPYVLTSIKYYNDWIAEVAYREHDLTATEFIRQTRNTNLYFSSTRIHGGRDARTGDVPYHVQIRVNGAFKCSGVLVEYKLQFPMQFVLTTAECVTSNDPDSIQPLMINVVGGRTVKEGDTSKNEQSINVILIDRHPGFVREKKENNIAILFLEKDFKITYYVTPVSLPGVANIYPLGYIFIVSGWGQMDENGEQWADKLQMGEFLIYPWTDCSERYKETSWAGITSTQMCTLNVKREGGMEVPVIGGPCVNDEGGPAIAPDHNSGRNFLAGIFSHTEQPCGSEYPPVYESVSHHLQWIMTTLLNVRFGGK